MEMHATTSAPGRVWVHRRLACQYRQYCLDTKQLPSPYRGYAFITFCELALPGMVVEQIQSSLDLESHCPYLASHDGLDCRGDRESLYSRRYSWDMCAVGSIQIQPCNLDTASFRRSAVQLASP